MKIITATAIQKGAFKGSFSYFTAKDINPGAIIKMPIQKRLVPGLVLKVEDVAEIKSSLRSSDFALRKVTTIIHPQFFTTAFIAAAEAIATLAATTLGQVVKSFVPLAILEAETSWKVGEVSGADHEPASHLRPDQLVLQEPDEERLTLYKGLVRESFARKQSVFLCLPTSIDIDKVVTPLERGIDGYIVILHGKLPKKKLLESWQRALTDPHPLLVVGTPSFLSLPRGDFGTLIIDRESSGVYKQARRPFIDTRDFAREYARRARLKLIFGDTVLRAETIYATERGDFLPLSPLKYRAFSEAEQILIPTKSKVESGARKKFQAVSPALLEILKESHMAGERSLLLAARRGLSPTTICNDCENILLCHECNAPLVAHREHTPDGEEQNVFLCHRCGTRQAIPDTCPHCGSWRLALLGVGIERVEQELKKQLPQVPLLVLDADTAPTPKKAQEIVQKFLTTAGGILLATEMALNYLPEKVENTAAVAIDSWFTIPDFRMSEKIFGTLLRLRHQATKRFIIQSRNPEERLFDYCLKGNLLDFYREEIAERERFNYPPFTVLVKVSLEGTSTRVAAGLASLETTLASYNPIVFESSSATAKNHVVMHSLLKLDPKRWPEEELLAKLAALPPEYTVDVNPESIL